MYESILGKDYLTCNLYKVGSNSWKIFTKSINEGLKKENLWSPNKSNISETCWPDCADNTHKIVLVSKKYLNGPWKICIYQVRHPLERLLSAYRHLFEREKSYDDKFISITSLREVFNKYKLAENINHIQVAGNKFRYMTWPQFVDMLINDEVDKHSWLAVIKGATSNIDPTGELHGTRKIRSHHDKSKRV